MGSLKRFNLDEIIHDFDAKFFFETGTWKGDGVDYAAKSNFEKIYSVEIVEDFANDAKKRFAANKNIEIINSNSIDAFNNTLDKVEGNCVFWLDAHYPAADQGLKGFNDELDEKIRLPLEKEVEIIARRIDRYKDVILIDDLRIYEEGPYKNGNMPENILPPNIRNIDFIFRLLSGTHTINRSYKDEGYIYVLPKGYVLKNGLLDKLKLRLKNQVF